MAFSGVCSILGCGKPAFNGRGWCSAHYSRWYRHGDPLYQTAPLACSVKDCVKTHFGHGYCSTHYYRWRTHGDPLGGGTKPGEALRFLEDVVLLYDGPDCLTWPYAASQEGYGRVWVEGRMHVVSRYACFVVHGAPPSPKHDAAHSCGKGHLGCVNPMHLSWKTPKENNADKVRHGTFAVGQDSHAAKLTDGHIILIRSLRGHMTQEKIARKFGVTQSTISAILTGREWSHVKSGSL